MTMYPAIRLLPGRHKRVKTGHPWVFSNEIARSEAAFETGALVNVVGDNGENFGTAIYNPHTLLAGRIVDRRGDVALDADYFEARLRAALVLRDRMFSEPYYRLIHAEADGLPGLIIDRYADAAVIQFNTAGMDRLTDTVVAALDRVFAAGTVILRNDSASREMEGLPKIVTVLRGDGDTPVLVRENGAEFTTHPAAGQKTGWFYDQRSNRGFIASLAANARMIDVFCYGGGFAIQALRAGAASATLVDRSATALDDAAASAARNGVDSCCSVIKADAFEEMERQDAAGERYDIVVADPPAFVRTRKDIGAGSRVYQKMARLAARLVAPGGILFVASCSHHMTPDMFREAVRKGIGDARRSGRILRDAGAGPDHPVHPHLPESSYLKSLTLALD
ncbi:MAG: class I SAM-dependent rRNA methyltransferase [Alphaproteobacteria bacterium]